LKSVLDAAGVLVVSASAVVRRPHVRPPPPLPPSPPSCPFRPSGSPPLRRRRRRRHSRRCCRRRLHRLCSRRRSARCSCSRSNPGPLVRLPHSPDSGPTRRSRTTAVDTAPGTGADTNRRGHSALFEKSACAHGGRRQTYTLLGMGAAISCHCCSTRLSRPRAARDQYRTARYSSTLPSPFTLLSLHTGCARARGANSRTRARAGLPSPSRTDCTRTRRANSRTRVRAGLLTHAQTARTRGEPTVAPAPVQSSLSHTQTARARGGQTVAPAPVQAPPSLSHTHQEDHPFRGRSAEHCRKSPPSLLSHSHTYCTRARRANSRARARASLPLTRTPTARARGERTVAPAPVQAFALTHSPQAHAESEQSHPRPCKAPSRTHRLR
jgi:hypothetical protein